MLLLISEFKFDEFVWLFGFVCSYVDVTVVIVAICGGFKVGIDVFDALTILFTILVKLFVLLLFWVDVVLWITFVSLLFLLLRLLVVVSFLSV